MFVSKIKYTKTQLLCTTFGYIQFTSKEGWNASLHTKLHCLDESDTGYTIKMGVQVDEDRRGLMNLAELGLLVL